MCRQADQEPTNPGAAGGTESTTAASSSTGQTVRSPLRDPALDAGHQAGVEALMLGEVPPGGLLVGASALPMDGGHPRVAADPVIVEPAAAGATILVPVQEEQGAHGAPPPEGAVVVQAWPGVTLPPLVGASLAGLAIPSGGASSPLGFILPGVRARVQGQAQRREADPWHQERGRLAIGSASEQEEWDMVGLGTMDVARAVSGVLTELRGTIILAGQVCHRELRCCLVCTTAQFLTDVFPLASP